MFLFRRFFRKIQREEQLIDRQCCKDERTYDPACYYNEMRHNDNLTSALVHLMEAYCPFSIKESVLLHSLDCFGEQMKVAVAWATE